MTNGPFLVHDIFLTSGLGWLRESIQHSYNVPVKQKFSLFPLETSLIIGMFFQYLGNKVFEVHALAGCLRLKLSM
jgi:hypothetical protein